MSGETLASLYTSMANWLTYVAFLGLTGSVVGQLVVRPRCDPHGPERALLWEAVSGRFRQVAVTSSVLLVVASATRLYAQTYSVFGVDEPVTAALLQVVAFDTRWGAQWFPHLVATILSVGAVMLISLVPRFGWWSAAAGVCALAATLPMTGHAMAHPGEVALPWILQTGHGLAAGVWVGTLAAVLLGVVALGAMGKDHEVAVLVGAFSPLAVGAVMVLVITGMWTTVLYLESWAQLWHTPWGRTLIFKLVLVLATGAVGAYNWKGLRPRLGTRAATGLLLRSSGLELVVAGLVLAVTAVLVHLPMSHE